MIGGGELIIILFLVLLLFGGKKLPELAKSLGQGLFEFKKACNGDTEKVVIESKTDELKKKIPKDPSDL